MKNKSKNSLGSRSTLQAGGKTYTYYSLPVAYQKLGDLSRLPFSLKVLLENLLRYEDDFTVSGEDISAFA